MNREISEFLAKAPSACFWRIAFAEASPEQQGELFQSVVRDDDALRHWVFDTFGVVAPQFEAPTIEVRAKPWLIAASPASDALTREASEAQVSDELVRYALAVSEGSAGSELIRFPVQEVPRVAVPAG